MSSTPSDYRKVLESIARKKSSVTAVFSDFVRMVACSLALQTREKEYLEVAKNYSKEELREISHAMGMLILEMEKHPYTDRLGTYYTEIASKATVDSRGEFYTPDPICELMARMTFNPELVAKEGRPVTINEPSVGAGGMILAIARLLKREEAPIDLMRVTCMDISPTAIDMCYINTTLWGIPAQMLCGNTLSLEFNAGYKNLHWMRVGEDERQRFLAFGKLFTEKQSELEKNEVVSIMLPVNFSFSV